MLRRDVLKSSLFLLAYPAEFIQESDEERIIRTIRPFRKDMVRCVNIEWNSSRKYWKYKFVYFTFGPVKQNANNLYMRHPKINTIEVDRIKDDIDYKAINRRLDTEVFQWYKGY